mgnify:CR=1 FL=1
MQYKPREYKPQLHDRFKALTLRQPWPDKILTGQKTIEVRNWKPSYRGELIITSSKKPEAERSGVTLCKVELVDVKPFKDLTLDEKYATAIPKDKWNGYRTHYGWILKNPRPVVQIPVKGQMGIWNLVLDRGILYEDYGDTVEVPKFPSDKYIRNLKWAFNTAIALTVGIVAYIIYLIFA